MNKVIIEWEGENAEQESRTAMDGYKWKSVVWDLDQELRKTTKYDNSVLGGRDVSEIEYTVAERYREIIRELLENYNLSLDE